MSDTTTITAEERAKWKVWAQPLPDGQTCPEYVFILRLLDALEQAEAQLAAALQVNATRQAEVTADVLNAMMAGITGQKESVRVEVEGFQCPYCNEISKTIEAATAHDAICPKHPAVIRAEQAEANVARLTKMVDWLAGQLHGLGPKYGDVICPQEKCHATSDCIDCWKEAARRAVADDEREGEK